MARRNFYKHKLTFIINIVGLSTGLASVILIFLWVHDEWRIDGFHERGKDLYQVLQNRNLPQGIRTWEVTPTLLAEAMATEFPEVEHGVMISNPEESPQGILRAEGQTTISEGLFVSPNFFEIFSYPLLIGEPEHLLEQKSQIVISQSLAVRLFGDTDDLIGKTVIREAGGQQVPFQVSGIFQDLPTTSTQQFEFVLSSAILLADEFAGKWNADYANTFLLLNPKTNIEDFNQRIQHYLNQKAPDRRSSSLFVQRFSDRYLYGHYENGKIAGGRITYVRLFIGIAAFILLMACINFMNLATAQASKKEKEVGVKKTIGAPRSALVFQFLSESMILSFLAFGIAIFVVLNLLPFFNQVTGKELTLNLDLSIIVPLVLITALTGLISGSYPAFYLSGISPNSILSERRSPIGSGSWIRQTLVVFQFGISVVFIVAVLVLSKQMQFIQQKHLGYDKENILTFTRPFPFRDAQVFLDQVRNIPGVLRASNMFSTILSGRGNQSGYSWSGEEEERKFSFKSPIIGYDFIETMDMETLVGRPYQKSRQNEREKIVMNESALKHMGLEDPIGKFISHGDQKREIIGVVKDFNYGSIHQPIEPLIFRFSENGNNILIRIEEGSEDRVIPQIEELFKTFHAAHPFEFAFLDKQYEALYNSEQKVMTLFRYASFLAILIAGMGLFGLVTFMVDQKAKEISIRKVLGASLEQITIGLSRSFIRLILIALVLALPVAWYFARLWLDNFAFHTELDWRVFALTSFLILIVAVGIIGVRTWMASLINPIQELQKD